MRVSLVLPWLVIAFLPTKANASSYILDVNLSPVAGVTSSGSGVGEVDVSNDQLSVFVTLFVSGLSGPVAAGTGVYGPEDDGPLVFPLTIPFPSSTTETITGTYALPPGSLAELIAGQLYIGVYTQQNQSTAAEEIGGEIQPTPEPTSAEMVGLGLAALGYVSRQYGLHRSRPAPR
jgi:hypothetical protein